MLVPKIRSRAAWYSASRSASGFGLLLELEAGEGVERVGRLRMRIGPASAATGTGAAFVPEDDTMSGMRCALLAVSQIV